VRKPSGWCSSGDWRVWGLAAFLASNSFIIEWQVLVVVLWPALVLFAVSHYRDCQAREAVATAALA
jgi:hypothetical protein